MTAWPEVPAGAHETTAIKKSIKSGLFTEVSSTPRARDVPPASDHPGG